MRGGVLEEYGDALRLTGGGAVSFLTCDGGDMSGGISQGK
jgi:hypothetical protein